MLNAHNTGRDRTGQGRFRSRWQLWYELRMGGTTRRWQ